MPTRKSFAQIKAAILKPAMTSQFYVSISFPREVQSYLTSKNINLSPGSNRADTLNLSCVDASLPGSSLATHEVTNDYHGVTERMAYRRIYDESLALTFYVDRDYNTIKVFEAWIDYISGVRSTVEYASPYVHTRNTYPRTYKNNIFLTKFEYLIGYHQIY